MELGLRERVCVVTGAAGDVGLETSLALAAEGAAVVLIGRREAPLRELADQCRDGGAAAALVLALDVTAPDAGERVRDDCLQEFGRIDVLVNNAGASSAKSIDELSDADWQAQWELHVMGPMRLMRALSPAMAERGWGRIVNVTSSSGKRPSGTNMAYGVTKAAQLSLSRSFADVYASRGVLVNAIAPGPLSGALWEAPRGLADQLAAARGVTREQVLETTASRLPLGRYGTAREVANVIVFLCSETASNVAGAAWSVDGGAVPVII